LHRLREAGTGQALWVRHCTYSDPERFYSYRRTTHAGEADYGRLISVIRL
ncbi:polyphenol oxidase, partial [Escherichia coli]|nr:polyphenol oxidase [Escherichia coli]